MTPDMAGLPVVGASRRHLGVVDGDAVPPLGLGQPGGGGMSVATGSMWNLPPHRRPKTMGNGSSGPAADVVFAVTVPFEETLNLIAREDLPEEHHAVVEPVSSTSRLAFEAALGATRPEWKRVWPT